MIKVGETEISIGLVPSEEGSRYCNILVNISKKDSGFKFALDSLEKNDVKSLISFLTHYLTKTQDNGGIFNTNRVTFYFYEDCVELTVDVAKEDVAIINGTWSIKVEDGKWCVKLLDEDIKGLRRALVGEYNRYFNVE